MDDLHHVREIESVWQGQGATRDPIVLESWLRCLNEYGLDPTSRAAAHIVTDRELREHRQRADDLINIARVGIERLYGLVAGQNYVLLLSDRAGVTVEYLGDERQKAALRKGGLYMGAEWSEARAGTCAVGACLEAGEALIIHQSDHFDATHAGLSCTAAPIYDTQGALVAALDLSLLASPLPRASQAMALNLVRQTVRRIELANIMAESRQDWVLRLASGPEALEGDPDCALALDGAGRVIGGTNGAMRLLAAATGQDWRKARGLIGRPVTDFLNIRSDRLDDLTQARAPRDRLIETRDGQHLFALATEPRPQPVRQPRRAVARDVPLPAPLARLAGDDPVMAQILSRAAMIAHSALPVVILGPTGTGKLTLAQAIHQAGGRGPVLALSCADLAQPEAEAQLFGRMGARKSEPGLLAELSGGTLILQNLEDLTERMQVRLSRLLAEGSFVPLGGLRPVQADVRVIGTSQRDLAALVAAGGMRADFFHRIEGVGFHLPSLAERQDILWLADRMMTEALGRRLDLGPEALRRLTRHGWPGNLRELGHMVRRWQAAVQAGGDPIEALLTSIGPPCQTLMPARDPNPEAAVLRRLLEDSGGNISLCARRLGVDRSTIHRRLRRLGLQ